MKYLFFFLLIGFSYSWGQTFIGGSGPIYDNQTIDIPVNISGLPSNIDTINFGLETVCINATHTWDADVTMWIVAPDGTAALLFSGVGGGDDNFTNTCLNQGASQTIASGTAPFTGTYAPNPLMGKVNNGQNPIGTWYLRVNDNYGADEGQVLSFSITFGPNPATYFAFQESWLPIVKIDTQGGTIVNEPKIMAEMKIIDNGPGVRNHLNDNANNYNGKIGIEYRGNYSLSLPQKPYALETWNQNGTSKDTIILDMPSENDWLLIANYNDKSFARNVIPTDAFRAMGHYATRQRFVDVVLNGDYQGIYLFTEKIKRDSSRVDVAKLDSFEIGGIAVTGGYMLKIDYWDNTNSWLLGHSPIGFPGLDIHMVQVYPEPDLIVSQQSAYIQQYIYDFENALYGANFTHPVLGYRNYIGVNSFIDYFIISELTRNVDGYKKSRYFYKDKDHADGTIRKLKAGPVWDFDWSQKDMWSGSEDGSGWMYPNCDQDVNAPGWYIRLLQDTLFANELRCRYDDLRRNILSLPTIHAKIDSVANVVSESQKWHFDTWGHLGSSTGTPEIGTPSQTYAEEVQKLKDWYTRRITWLDANMPGTLNGCSMLSLGDLLAHGQLNAFPNPFNEGITLSWDGINLAGASVILIDQTGRVIQTETILDLNTTGEFKFNNLSELSNGFYFVRITKGEETVNLKLSKR